MEKMRKIGYNVVLINDYANRKRFGKINYLGLCDYNHRADFKPFFYYLESETFKMALDFFKLSFKCGDICGNSLSRRFI